MSSKLDEESLDEIVRIISAVEREEEDEMKNVDVEVPILVAYLINLLLRINLRDVL